MSMDSQLQTFLKELYQQGTANDSQQADRRQKMLNLEPETAQFLSFLVRSNKCTRILEIGTSNGYSTCWLAWAAQQTGGRVTSIDREQIKHALAAANLRRAGLRKLVELHCGDATEIVASQPGPFDCIFFDADRYSAPAQLSLLLPKLTPTALLLADNVLSHPHEIAGYLQAVQALEGFEHMIIPIGKGLSIAYRDGNRDRCDRGLNRFSLCRFYPQAVNAPSFRYTSDTLPMSKASYVCCKHTG